jgi:hypothetical protein
VREPRRDHYIEPATGPDSASALDVAIGQLAAARDMDLADPPSALHLVASLLAESQARLAELIAAAHDYGCSWAEVADLLGVSRASAWQRWSSRPQPGPAPLPKRKTKVGRP